MITKKDTQLIKLIALAHLLGEAIAQQIKVK